MIHSISKSNIVFLTFICFFAFLLFGITDNLKGVTLPYVISEFDLDYGAGGNILFGEYIGFLVATLVTGILADKYGLKSVIVLAGIFLAIGVGGYSSLNTPALLSISLFVVGLGLGAFELGPNAVIISLYHERKGLYLNLMAVMHGLGSMIAPLVTGWLMSSGSDWRSVYRWDLLLIFIFILSSLSLRFPASEEKNALDFRSIPKMAFNPPLPGYYAAMLFYVASEIGLASWMVIYLQDIRAFNEQASGNYLAIFFATLMIGRFLGSFIVARAGYLRSVWIASLLAALCLFLGIYTRFIFFIPFTGLFFSIIFPTLTASVSDIKHESANTVLGVLFTFSGLGGMLGPWLIGWVGKFFGLQAGLSAIFLISLLTSGFVFLLYKKQDGTRLLR